MSASKPTARSATERARRRRRFDEGETREALLDAAEELFATLGVEGVSIRSINVAAGLTAPSVHYHFGTKDDLLLAVLRRRNTVVTQRLAELLDELDETGGIPSVHALVGAVAGSYLELLNCEPVKGMRWLRLMGRLWLAEDPRLLPLNAETGHLTERLLAFVRRMFPGEREQVLESRWRVAVSTLTQMLGNMDTQAVRNASEQRVAEAYVDMLVDFVASGFSALMRRRRAATVRRPGSRAATAKAGGRPKAVSCPAAIADQPRHAEGASREALMDAAEELFAALGVEGVSIRSINAAAGLSPPAVHYHFGSKDKLVHAVLLRRGRLVTQRLATLLDALGARGRMPTPHALFSVIASAYLDLIECEPVRGLQWLRLLGRLWLAQDPRLASLDAETGHLHERLIGLLKPAFRRVPEPVLERRFRLAASTLLQMLGNSDAHVTVGGAGEGQPAVRAYVDMLVDFVASGFDAVMAPTRAAGGRKASRG